MSRSWSARGCRSACGPRPRPVSAAPPADAQRRCAPDRHAWTSCCSCSRLVIWIVVALLALENLGINVGPLVAGLGVGGIAIALAVQTILGDLFASLSIALDKPVRASAIRCASTPSRAPSSRSASRVRACAASPASRSSSPTPICSRAACATWAAPAERRALFTLALSYETRGALLELVPAAGGRRGRCLPGHALRTLPAARARRVGAAVRGVLLRRERRPGRDELDAARSIRSTARSCSHSRHGSLRRTPALRLSPDARRRTVRARRAATVRARLGGEWRRSVGRQRASAPITRHAVEPAQQAVRVDPLAHTAGTPGRAPDDAPRSWRAGNRWRSAAPAECSAAACLGDCRCSMNGIEISHHDRFFAR